MGNTEKLPIFQHEMMVNTKSAKRHQSAIKAVNQQNYTKAKNLSEKLIRDNDARYQAEGFYLLAHIAEKHSDFNKARKLAKKGLQAQAQAHHLLLLAGRMSDLNGNINDAITHLEKLHQLDPEHHEATLLLASNLCKVNQFSDAIDMLHDLFEKKSSPDVTFWLLYAYTYNPEHSYSKRLENFLITTLNQKNSASMILNPLLGKTLLKKFNLENNHILSDEGLNTIFEDDFIIHALQNILIHNREIEKIVSSLRRKILLDSMINNEVSPRHLSFLHAIGLQSFYQEYLLPISPDEKKLLSEIDEIITIMLSADTVDTAGLGIFLMLKSMYQPLYTPQLADKISDISITQWPDYSQVLFNHVLYEIIEEKSIINEIVSFGNINNETTQSVQNQYEENPYPRWQNFSINAPVPLLTLLALDCGPLNPTTIPNKKRLKALVAGCGTGRHALYVAKQYSNVDVVAIDISKASLAYAIKKTREYGVDNIQYYHADILEIDQFPETFDIIESVGVLHHMKDPLLGFKKIRSLLNPQGIMKIALYSALARQDVIHFREIIQQAELDVVDNDIIQFREALFENPELNSKVQHSLRLNDLYYLSGVRDLFFHVQEQCYTIADISKMLDDTQLNFLAFNDLEDTLLNHYRQSFPSDPFCRNIQQWAAFEKENPNLFIKEKIAGMYQFWCQAK